MSERTMEIAVECVLCGTEHILMVRPEDWTVYQSPDRPYVQDIFPYLTASERELLISGICDTCFHRMFEGGEDDE